VSESESESEPELREESVRAVRLGHGANCSSVGSVIDTLFLGATVGGAILAAVCAAMKAESVTVVGNGTRSNGERLDEADEADAAAAAAAKEPP
jgi:hypothetical protein